MATLVQAVRLALHYGEEHLGVTDVFGAAITMTLFKVLVVEVTERPWINSIVIRGLEHAKAGDIQDTTKFKAGEPFNRQELQATESMIRVSGGRTRQSTDRAPWSARMNSDPSGCGNPPSAGRGGLNDQRPAGV